MALTTSARTSFPTTTPSRAMALRHREFDLTIRTVEGRFGEQSYAYSVLHNGHVLHESGGDYGSASAADKAARQLIDDALCMFDHLLAHLADNDA